MLSRTVKYDTTTTESNSVAYYAVLLPFWQYLQEVRTELTDPYAEPRALTLHTDGYVRLALESLLAVPFVHYFSDVDADSIAEARNKSGKRNAIVSGYTEWISRTTPTISLGWDWQADLSDLENRYVATDLPRTNLMLVDNAARDLGRYETLMVLHDFIRTLDWQNTTTHCINA